METYLLRYFLCTCLITLYCSKYILVKANDNATTEEQRHPRVIGRIVKLYSGYKPEPVHCRGEGFQGDPVDCSAFYRCMKSHTGKYTVLRFTCGPGTIYDPETEICNHPQNTKRSECGIVTNNQPRLLSKNTKEIENEIGEIQQEVPMPISTKAPNFAARRTVPIQVPFPSNPWFSTLKNTKDVYATVQPNVRYTRQDTISTLNKLSQRQQGPPCASDGFMGDNEDCRKFYRCISNLHGGFIRHEYSCSESTVWDNDMQTCNHPWATARTNCGGKKEYSSSYNFEKISIQSDNVPVQQQSQINYGSKVSQSQLQISHGSVIQNQTQINYANGTNNNQESEVSQNQTQISYDSAVSQSQQQINYGNKGTQTQTQIDHTNQASQTQTQEHEDSTTEPSSSTTEPNSSHSPVNENSNNECTTSGFMGDSNDCKKFYRCVDNGKGGYTKYDFSCGDGTVWDQSIEACNHAWAVKDCRSSEPTKSPVTTEKITTTQFSTESATNKNEDSHAPIQNNDYDTGYGQPQNENNADSTTSSSTTLAPNTMLTTKEPQISNINNENECKQSGFMGDSNNCKKFYRCVDNGRGSYNRYEFSCGEGTVWDALSETCNHEWAVKDCGSKAPTENSAQKEPTSTSQHNTNVEMTTSKYEDSNQNPDYDTAYGQNTNEQSTTTTTTSLSTSQSQTVGDSHCQSSGFIGDNKDCKKFYRCVDDGKGSYTRYEFSCGEGTVWDESIEGCNHEWAVKKCGSNGSSTSSIPSTTQSISNSNPTESSDISISSTESTEKTTTSTTTQPIDGSSSQNDICNKEGFIGDRTDCTKFHRCVEDGKGGFTKYDFKCGEGTVWDQNIQSCNHPSTQNNCSSIENESYDNKPEPVNDEAVAESTTSKTTRESTETNESTSLSSPPQSSTSVCESEGFYGNPDDCKKFYRCVDDGKGEYTKYDFSCGDGTIWDQEITACNHDNGKNDCSKSPASPVPEQTQTEGTEHTTTTTMSSISPEKPSEKPIDESSASSDQCSSDGFYANSKDCRKFYRCVENGKGGFTKYDFTCGEGTVWVQEIQACDHDDGSMQCNKSQSSPSSNPPNNEEQSKPEPNPILQDEEPAPATESSSSTYSPTTQNSNSMSKDVCQEEGYFGNTEDCTKFYRCVDNGNGGLTKYDFTCGEGTIWDQDITTCNHPQDVSHPSCKEQSNSESSSSSTTSSSSSFSTQTSSTTESGQSSSDCSQEETSKKPGNKNVTCEKAGFYPDPNDCKKFYRCVDWDGDGTKFSVFHFDCGEGTIWDPALDTCNYEDSVYPPRDCSGSQSQNENVSQEPSTTESPTTEQSETTSSSSETTAQQTTTTEQTETTSQGTTTTEKSTTQKTTTSQPTTQQSTTEKTTTQQSTTSEKTTTQQSTTSEQTTTQQSTTSEQTTPQQSPSSEQTTTQQLSTSELTTQQITSEQTTQHNEMEQTTQESTTQQQTTQESTTQQQTTQGLTTQAQTTQESSTQSNTEESTTNQQDNQTTTESEQESTTESSGSSEDKCPETDDDQNLFVCPTSFRRHPKYCNLFYQCTEDDDTHDANIAVFHCPNNTIYDESKTQCVEEKKADKKCNGEIAQRRRFKRLYSNNREPIVVSKEKHSCPAAGHYPFEKNEECSPAFLKCSKIEGGKIRGYVYRCPEGYVYWSVSRRCETKTYLKDCKYTSNDWNRRWEIPVERSNVAKY